MQFIGHLQTNKNPSFYVDWFDFIYPLVKTRLGLRTSTCRAQQTHRENSLRQHIPHILTDFVLKRDKWFVTKRGQMNLKPWVARVNSRHPPSEIPADVQYWTCWSEGKWLSTQTVGKSSHHKWLASRKIWNVEELETLPPSTEPRTSHHRSPGGERRSMISLERKGHRQSDQHWNCFKGNAGETSERRDGACMGFSELLGATLNWTKLTREQHSVIIEWICLQSKVVAYHP